MYAKLGERLHNLGAWLMLTNHKWYKVLKERGDGCYLIINDNGEEQFVHKTHFIQTSKFDIDNIDEYLKQTEF